ncbi:uncharacterized protein LOC108153877 [Drosophila miranda]|uniref:uncharacterized protein LOC108153877 n=1 Tax=Drosophila miranda TaxID=7229 RepID=UPI0007E74011|nr:uncharacterized protein LOC108153877 [Drosophila miranda]
MYLLGIFRSGKQIIPNFMQDSNRSPVAAHRHMTFLRMSFMLHQSKSFDINPVDSTALRSVMSPWGCHRRVDTVEKIILLDEKKQTVMQKFTVKCCKPIEINEYHLHI